MLLPVMARDREVSREDFEAALRFLADGGMRASHRAARVETLLRSIVQALVESRTLDVDAFERNLAAARAAQEVEHRQRAPRQG